MFKLPCLWGRIVDMAFVCHSCRVQLPDVVWDAFLAVQIFLSRHGSQLGILIVPKCERYLPAGVVQEEVEVLFLKEHSPSLLPGDQKDV